MRLFYTAILSLLSISAHAHHGHTSGFGFIDLGLILLAIVAAAGVAYVGRRDKVAATLSNQITSNRE